MVENRSTYSTRSICSHYRSLSARQTSASAHRVWSQFEPRRYFPNPNAQKFLKVFQKNFGRSGEI